MGAARRERDPLRRGRGFRTDLYGLHNTQQDRAETRAETVYADAPHIMPPISTIRHTPHPPLPSVGPVGVPWTPGFGGSRLFRVSPSVVGGSKLFRESPSVGCWQTDRPSIAAMSIVDPAVRARSGR